MKTSTKPYRISRPGCSEPEHYLGIKEIDYDPKGLNPKTVNTWSVPDPRFKK